MDTSAENGGEREHTLAAGSVLDVVVPTSNMKVVPYRIVCERDGGCALWINGYEEIDGGQSDHVPGKTFEDLIRWHSDRFEKGARLSGARLEWAEDKSAWTDAIGGKGI